ncbi:TIGR02300 family protein [Chelatococcus sp. SYSU_G07232]|uniref:TIGR02300 family protein n=1 Tax=Chelatococcus albus TaxID=3047466 RepID=A0ABT7AFG0_9HYPH|nr:TIGR02300 family protein [Chelatococcus sp. SYSU_G07232]MDJ1157584.1 TIGR02300 family protein [Chelatococcus sp. SYSU_G07232]
MAKPELGTKRQCLSCGAKFYDLNKDPIVCPKCGTVFQAVALAMRGRPEAVAAHGEDEESEIETGAAELVSLDEVEAGDDGKELPGDEDIDVGEDIGDDDTFLEEDEESEDDVSGLIDSDLEDDEEA